MNFSAASKVPVRLLTSLGLVAGVVLLLGALPAAADTTAQPLPFAQNWSNTGLITANDNWSGVPGVVGYLGQDITTSTGTNPQTLLTDSTFANDVDVIANQTSTTLTSGGVAEFELADPVVALQGSGTADAPYLLLTLDTTGLTNITVSYNLRDIDGTADNAVQPVALQYRVGGSGNFTNVPAAYVADATTGPSLATQVTAVNATLPANANNQALLQVRVITANAVGSDEWIGVDDISVTASADAAPFVQSTTPANGATDIPVNANVVVTFSEAVNVTDPWFTITCPISGGHSASVSSSDSTTFTLDPIVDFAAGETCTVTIAAASVSDQDGPPDLMATNYLFSFTTASPPPPASGIFFSEYIEGSSFNKAVEIYNGTGAPVDLGAGGYKVELYSNGSSSVSQSLNLTGTLAAGDVIVLAHPSANAAILAEADVTSSTVINWNGDDAVALRKGATLADVIGQIGFDPGTEWGTGLTSTADNTLRRKPAITQGDSNGSDAFDPAIEWDGFATDTFDGLGFHGEVAPKVKATTPAQGAAGVALDANISITFSEAVNVSGNWFTISCGTSGSHTAAVSGGSTTFTLDPAVNFAGNESCTVTVLKDNVTDQDTDDGPDKMTADYTFTFQTADVFNCGDLATLIHDVQGSGLASPIIGSPVTIEGIVVGDYQATSNEFGGFYLQEETAHADTNALISEGIFVYDNGFGTDVAPGDVVRVRGTVTEFFDLTEINAVTAVKECSSGASVPATSVSLPVADVADLEAFEGMLVHFAQTLTATDKFTLGRFGEVSLSAGGRLFTPTTVATPGAAAQAKLADNNRRRILLDDGNSLQNRDPTRYPAGGLSASNTLRVGDTLSSLTGVMDFRFSNYRIQPVGPLSFSPTNPRASSPPAVGGNLKVASFNVLNYFNGNGSGLDGAPGGYPTARGANDLNEFNRQRAKIISAISAIDADVVGLMEIENDPTPSSAIEDLVAGLNTAMGAGTYAFIDTGVVGTDAIRVALIYKPAAVTPVGPYEILDSTDDPRFIDTRSRPALAQTFEKPTGARLTVLVNHLKSKGSACAGDPDTGDGQGNCNVTRTQAAEAIVDWLATDPTGSGDPDFLVMGDLNAYTFEDPITTFTSNGYTNLVRQFGGLGAYSYVFDGGSGYLDHALATSSLAAQATSVADWHINADEPIVLDYNVEFKTTTPDGGQVSSFYSPGPFRSSDHDPVIIGLQLNASPTVSAGGPYSIAEGGSGTLTASGNDPDGDTLTYTWDLDNDGDFDDATGQSVTFSAASIDGPASQTVRVRATDPSGASAVGSTTVDVTNVAPTATFNAPASNLAGFAFTLSLTDPDDAAPADEPTLTYAFDCGDGSGYSAFTTSNTAVCPTTSVGTRSVGGTVRDDDGGETEYGGSVTSTVTYASLCALVKLYVADAGIANSLCVKLDAAAAAAERWNDNAKDGQLRAFANEVEAQSGKALTPAQAAILKALVEAL